MQKLLLLFSATFLFIIARSQAFSSSNLPIVVINTNGQAIQDDPKIGADMGIIFNDNGARNNLSDPFNHFSGRIGIELRGQSSQMFPMKSYGLELWDNAGGSVNKSLFGLPSESDWILYAPYTDKTLMRNFLAYTMSRELGRWASNCRYVELVVNGDYKGIYVFMEKIKRGSGRVNISKIGSNDITGDAVTGGYIFSLDKGPDGWFSGYVTPGSPFNAVRQFSYVYPKLSNIVQQQKDYLKSYVDAFEDALAGQGFQDPVNGVRKYADLSSFIDYFLINEISRNVDGYRLSTFFYKNRDSKDGRIVAGPVWDYDLAFRNADYCDGSRTSGWAYNFNLICPTDGAGLIPFWWTRLQEDTAFKSDLRCRWKAARSASLSEGRINNLIDSVSNLLSEASQRHFQRWPILGQYVWPNPQPIPDSYDGEIAALKKWIHERVQWIDANISNVGACADYPVEVKSSVIVSIYPNPVPGDVVVRVRSRNAQAIWFEVMDAAGRRCYSGTTSLIAGFNNLQLPASGWSRGVYLVRVMTAAGERLSYKIVRQ